MSLRSVTHTAAQDVATPRIRVKLGTHSKNLEWKLQTTKYLLSAKTQRCTFLVQRWKAVFLRPATVSARKNPSSNKGEKNSAWSSTMKYVTHSGARAGVSKASPSIRQKKAAKLILMTRDEPYRSLENTVCVSANNPHTRTRYSCVYAIKGGANDAKGGIMGENYRIRTSQVRTVPKLPYWMKLIYEKFRVHMSRRCKKQESKLVSRDPPPMSR